LSYILDYAVGLKINLVQLIKKIRSTSSLIPFGKPVTISIPTNKLNTRKIKTSFMPNLVHSLDASNIHILCEKLNNQPLYTIHDCLQVLLIICMILKKK